MEDFLYMAKGGRVHQLEDFLILKLRYTRIIFKVLRLGFQLP
jgi:hypothetical protein